MEDFTAKLKEQIIKISPDGLLLFCNLNCEKMMPGYERFSKMETWGDTSFFVDSIEAIYAQIIKPTTMPWSDDFVEKTESNSPDLDRFDSVWASYAFDFCCAFDSLVQFLITKDIVHVFNNSQACIDTVDMFVQEKEGVTQVRYEELEALEKMISNDEYMLRENARQLALLSEIAGMTVIDDTKIEELRALNLAYKPFVNYAIIG